MKATIEFNSGAVGLKKGIDGEIIMFDVHGHVVGGLGVTLKGVYDELVKELETMNAGKTFEHQVHLDFVQVMQTIMEWRREV